MLPLVTTRRTISTAQAPSARRGQQLAADGVADVVGEQGQAADAQLVHEGGHHVGLPRQGIGKVGFGREPVPEPVEQKEATSVAQRVEHGREVERRSGEAVQEQEGLVCLVPDRWCVNGEDAMPAQVAVAPEGFPAAGRGDGHVPESFCTTGPRSVQASDSIDQ